MTKHNMATFSVQLQQLCNLLFRMAIHSTKLITKLYFKSNVLVICDCDFNYLLNELVI